MIYHLTELGTLHPRFVVLATGHSGEKNFPSHIKGIGDFNGGVLCHSADFHGARPNGKTRKAVVVGSGNSGHDIAQDFYENGYDVTMVQRSSTCVMTSKAGLDVLMGGLYVEDGVRLVQFLYFTC
jgi:cation diffusion facilitator CzcD-associated flavoprotein CzcO